MKRFRILGILTLGLVAAGFTESESYSRLQTSLRVFQQNMEGLKDSGTDLSSFERVIYSIMLTAANANPPSEKESAAPGRRT